MVVGGPITAPTVGRALISGSGPVDDILPVSYVSGGGAKATSGVIGISLATGQPVWGCAATTAPSVNRSVITVVSDSVVIITLAAGVGPDWPTVDARTGEPR